MFTYYSNAEWPEESGVRDEYGDRKSSDKHRTEREAIGVCKMLERDGLGGEGKFFPVRTWVSEKCSYETSGWCESKEKCQYKYELEDGSAACEAKI